MSLTMQELSKQSAIVVANFTLCDVIQKEDKYA